MKNKNLISLILLITIMVLIAIAAGYYVSNAHKDDYTKTDDKMTDDAQDVGVENLIVIDSFSDFNKYVNSTEEIFMVLGKENCSFCSMYRPVLNSIMENYGVEIVYLNLSGLSEDDYYNVKNSDITVPGKCTKDGNDIKLKDGFGTPLSIFLKDGIVYDCIRGYKDYDTLEILLETIGYI